MRLRTAFSPSPSHLELGRRAPSGSTRWALTHGIYPYWKGYPRPLQSCASSVQYHALMVPSAVAAACGDRAAPQLRTHSLAHGHSLPLPD
jgi:hypothetical protein